MYGQQVKEISGRQSHVLNNTKVGTQRKKVNLLDTCVDVCVVRP